METKTAYPTTLIEAITFFADEENCQQTMMAIRFPGGICCPRCGDTAVTRLSRRTVWKCNGCKRQFTMKVGTIFEDSPLSFSKWLPCVWLLAGAKNGISSCEVARALGVCQKTAWFMLHRVRHAMNTGSFNKPLRGVVEADETFIGGREANKHESKKLHAGRGAVGKAIVAGVIERGGQASITVVPSTTAKHLRKNLQEKVEPGSIIMTDAHGGYHGLNDDYIHAVVDHAVEYVRGSIHTNNIENYWSLLKRTLKGTYVAVDVPHLEAYLDEQSFRFNNRKDTDQGRFLTALAMVAGKRLTYEQLTSWWEGYYLQPGG